MKQLQNKSRSKKLRFALGTIVVLTDARLAEVHGGVASVNYCPTGSGLYPNM